MEKILEGNLSRFQIPDLLTFLNLGRRDGVLVLETLEQETKLFLRQGNPVYASSTKEQLRFGTLLERFGKVTPDQLGHALDRQRSGGYRIGQVLLWEKVLSEEELASFLKVQVSEVIFDTFSWGAGVFSFFDKISPPATAVTLEMELPNLIMEGVRRIDERARLAEMFPDLNRAVEVVANPEKVKQSVTLTKDEWQVFFLIDGRRTLAEICRLAGNPDELATLQILYHLLVAKFLEVLPPGMSAPAAPLPAAVVEGEGTQHFPSKPQGPVSVEFAPGRPRSDPKRDDTKEIVNPKAVKYLDDAKKLTVSRLVLLKEDGDTSFPLIRDSYTLGRHKNNDIMISDPKVSAFHARIDRSADGFVLVDLTSRNGSFLNDKRIESGLLKTGDEIRLGTARLTYKVDYISTV